MFPPENAMRTLILSIAGFLLASSLGLAQRAEFQLVVRNTTPIDTKEFPFILGADVAASDGTDTALGEVEIPTIPLPGDIYYVWTSVETNGEEIWLSPKDLRPLRPERYLDTFELNVQWTGGKLDFRWPGVKPNFIDSAYIIDAVLDFPNNVFKYRLWSTETAETTNPGLDKFRVLVWYDARSMSVEEDNAIASLRMAPMPFADHLNIKGQGASGILRLYDAQGRLVIDTELDGSDRSLSTAGLAAGPYIVELITADGSARRRLVIRQ